MSIDKKGETASQSAMSFGENTRVCNYLELQKETIKLIDGLYFTDLPKEVSLDPRIYKLFETLRHAAVAERDSRVLRQKPKSQLSVASLSRKRDLDQDITLREHSQRLYENFGHVVSGVMHVGTKTATSREKDIYQDQGVPAIVDIHTHPLTSGPSIGDLGSILQLDDEISEKCLYMISACELNILVVRSNNAGWFAPEKIPEDLDTRTLRGRDRELIRQFEIEAQLPSEIIDSKQKQFISQFWDVVQKATKYKVGVYASKANADVKLMRVSSLEQIIELSKGIAKF